MDLRKFKQIQSKYAKNDQERMNQRIEMYDTDMTYRERIVEEMLMDLMDRVEKLETILTPQE